VLYSRRTNEPVMLSPEAGMRALAIELMFLALTSLFWACKDEGSTAITSGPNVAGNWFGTLDGTTFKLALTQVEFEGSIAVSGTASLTKDTTVISYAVMNGGQNRVDRIYFSLYRVPVANNKEEYHISGTMSLPTLQGTYDLLDQSGTKLNSGTWQVQKVP
jgi:hypothetical protein